MFRVLVPCHGELHTAAGVVEFDLDAGEHTPSTPDEETVLAHLVAVGAAEPVTDKPRPRRTKE